MGPQGHNSQLYSAIYNCDSCCSHHLLHPVWTWQFTHSKKLTATHNNNLIRQKSYRHFEHIVSEVHIKGVL